MYTDTKLIRLLMELLSQPIAKRVEPGISEVVWPPEDIVIPGYDSHLQKIAVSLVQKAEQGDIKAIDKIREIVGEVEWPEKENIAS